jgi:hypothetical protein
MRVQGVVPMLAAALALSSAAKAAEPVLYPNAHLKTVGQGQAEHDIADCGRLAKAAGARGELDDTQRAATSTAIGGAAGAATGAAGGAVVGSAGRGAAVGAASGATAGLMRSIFSREQPSQPYRNYVDRCLEERGYESMGWD